MISRRQFLHSCGRTLIGTGALCLLPGVVSGRTSPLTRPIPSSGERIPAIGMGTWVTFNVGDDPAVRDARSEVLRTFFALGGGMIDSSPMYGSAEAVLGYGFDRLGIPPALFSATKVWTSSAAEGVRQVSQSHTLWGIDRFDLLQVHNLVAWRDHLPMLQDMQRRQRLRYVGVTTSHGRRHDELERIMRRKNIDFVQLTYNIADREVERRLLPLAQDRGIAVIANRPFRRGQLVDRLETEPLPAWAADIGCDNWPQFLLKFIVSHPAVTCAIPATSQVAHMHENMAAMHGPMPDAATRQRMIDYVYAL